MPHFTKLEMHRRIGESATAARRLTCTGMSVIVVKDDASELQTKLRLLPWKLGSGHYVCGVEGISGGFDCTRVRPA